MEAFRFCPAPQPSRPFLKSENLGQKPAGALQADGQT